MEVPEGGMKRAGSTGLLLLHEDKAKNARIEDPPPAPRHQPAEPAFTRYRERRGTVTQSDEKDFAGGRRMSINILAYASSIADQCAQVIIRQAVADVIAGGSANGGEAGAGTGTGMGMINGASPMDLTGARHEDELSEAVTIL
eukprot:comp5927_c0_seq1/m.1786 comp5927_c0_seq1/g.1786  ORF comp5927_c0_seq1/g.1786 comp5927_c0_seq1/m.1786 type:complete len:143 (-) comp5927_c0_seq1:43-471(-)